MKLLFERCEGLEFWKSGEEYFSKRTLKNGRFFWNCGKAHDVNSLNVSVIDDDIKTGRIIKVAEDESCEYWWAVYQQVYVKTGDKWKKLILRSVGGEQDSKNFEKKRLSGSK